MPTTNQPVPPDAEIIFRKFLLGKTAITDLVSTRIATRLPRDAEMPFITFQRAGGVLLRPTSQVHMQSRLDRLHRYQLSHWVRAAPWIQLE